MSSGSVSGGQTPHNINQAETAHEAHTGSIAPNSPQMIKALHANKQNFFVAVFFALLSSMNVIADLAQTQAMSIQVNATLQMKMNQGMNKMQQIPVPLNATSIQLKNYDSLNANMTIVRQNTQGTVLAARQEGQQLSTQAQIYVEYMQQIGSQVTAVLSIIITVTQLINKISPGASQG